MYYEGECFLKTKSDRFKKHWVVVLGNDLFCYRTRDDDKHRIMHSLVGTYLKELPEETVNSKEGQDTFWPVKIVLPPNKSRVLYFQTRDEQSRWIIQLKEAVGYANLFDFYELDKTLGKGQFGLVKLATHKKTG